MKFKKVLAALVVATLLAVPIGPTALASTRTTHSHQKNNRPKTVHVRSYKKKNGTVVKAHNRATPQR
jgi:hypothetical protein